MNKSDQSNLECLAVNILKESHAEDGVPGLDPYTLNQHTSLFDEVKSKIAPDNEMSVADYIIDALSDEQRIQDFFNY